MSQKPLISAELLANLTEAVPARIQRKFEAERSAADGWAWTQVEASWTVNAGAETVTLHATSLTVAEHVSCSCLLGPRCLHVLSVIHTLGLADLEDVPIQEESKTPAAEPETLELSVAQKNAARSAFDAGARLLERGVNHATLTNLTELLRALHLCRVHGLYRLSASGQRVAESVRLFRENSPGFDRELFTDELTELLSVSHTLLNSPFDKAMVGVARREYVDVGGKKLAGVFCEPVATRTGYAGVVAYLADDDGLYWTLSDVMPGNASRASGAYQGGVSIGDVSMSPKELCRSGVLLQSATASEEGRLGSGKKVKAVTFKPKAWDELPFWDVDLKDQIDRALQSHQDSGAIRAGSDLVYLNLEVVGAWQESLIVKERSGVVFKCRPVQFNPALAYSENTKMLARAPGLVFRAIARTVAGKIDTIELYAIGPSPGVEDPALTLQLPESWLGRANFGLDSLKVEHVGARRSRPVEVDFNVKDLDEPMQLIRHRLVAAAYGGRLSTQASSNPIARDAARLETLMMGNAALILRHLSAVSSTADREFTGELAKFDPHELARTWAMAANYIAEARLELVRAAY